MNQWLHCSVLMILSFINLISYNFQRDFFYIMYLYSAFLVIRTPQSALH